MKSIKDQIDNDLYDQLNYEVDFHYFNGGVWDTNADGILNAVWRYMKNEVRLGQGN